MRHDPVLETTTTSPSSRSGPPPRTDNPDEITIGDDAVEDSPFDAPSGGAMVPRVAESIAPPPPQNPDEITLDDEIEEVEPPPPPPPPARETGFLALDKCLPQRQFLEASPPPFTRSENQSTNLFCVSDNHQVIDILTQEPAREDGEQPSDAVVLCYDPEWLAITRAFQPYLSREPKQATYPSPDDARAAISREWDWVHANVPPKLNLGAGGDAWRVDACQRFVVRSPPAGGAPVGHPDREGNSAAALAQTEAFTALLEMENVVAR